MTPIWLGIETGDQGRICAATLTGENPWTNKTSRRVRYRSLQEFQEAWNEEFDGWKFEFSVGLDYFESLPSQVAGWLTTKSGIQLEYFNYSSLYPYYQDELRFLKIPDTFHKAQILAMCAFHRSHAYRLSQNLITEVYTMQNQLRRLEEGLNRLAHTIPPAKNQPHSIYCPF